MGEDAGSTTATGTRTPRTVFSTGYPQNKLQTGNPYPSGTANVITMTKQPFRSSNFDPRPVVNLQESILKMGPVMNSIMADEVLGTSTHSVAGKTVAEMITKNMGGITALDTVPTFAKQAGLTGTPNIAKAIAGASEQYKVSWAVTDSQQLANLRRAISGISKMEAFDTSAIASAVTSINKISQQASKNLAGIQDALQLIDWSGIETAVNRTIKTANQLNVQDVSEFVDIVREQPEMAAAQKAAQENPAVMEQLYAFLRTLWMITKVAGASEEATGLLVIMALVTSYMQAGIPGVASTAYGMALSRIALKQQELQDKLNNRERDV